MRILLIALIAAIFALPAAAQEQWNGPEPGSTELGAGAVYYDPGDGSGRWGPSAMGRYYFTNYAASELSVDYRNESYPRDVSLHTGAAQLSILGLIGHGSFRVEPLVGAGYYLSRLDDNGMHRNLGRFAAHLGIGVEVWPGKQKLWGALASYRHVWLPDLDTGTGSFQRAGEQLNFAITRRFGKSAS